MKFRKIIVEDTEYGWRVHKSADKVEVRGPLGIRTMAELLSWEACEANWAFNRHGRSNPFYVKFPITPKLVAEWIKNHALELSGTRKMAADRPKTIRRPHCNRPLS